MTQYPIPKSLITPVNPNSLIIPSRPFRVVADCSSAGNWRSPDGQTIYCSPRKESDRHLGILPMKLDYYIDWGIEVADLIFVPVVGEAVGNGNELNKLPFGLLSVVKLKRNASGTGSLDNFEVWFNRLCPTTGRHPATWTWWSYFERKTGEDEDGKGISWHRLHWLPTEINSARSYEMLVQVGEKVEADPELKSLPSSAPKQTKALQPAEKEEEKVWFLPNSKDGMTLTELVRQINPDTKVWRQGMKDWAAAASVPEVAEIILEKAPTLPPTPPAPPATREATTPPTPPAIREATTPDAPPIPPTPTAPPEEKIWFPQGSEEPVTMSELLKTIRPDTLIWRQGLEDWTPAAKVPELADAMGLEEEF